MTIRNAYVKIEANLGYSPVEPDDHVSRAQKAIAETPPTQDRGFDDAVICWRSTASTTTSLPQTNKALGGFVKKHFLWIALTASASLLGTATAQVDLTALKASGDVGSDHATLNREIVLDDLPTKSAAEAAIPGRFSSLRPQNGLNDSEYANAKREAVMRRNGATATNLAPPSIVRNATNTPSASLAFQGTNESCSFVIPSDMAIAVGPNWELQVVNDCMSVFDRNGVRQAGFPKSLNTFFGLPANNFSIGRFTSDPRAFYDVVAKRYVMVLLFEDFPNSRGFVEIAASQTSNPKLGWNTYQVEVGSGGQCPDFPALGHGRSGDTFVGSVAVGFNLFGCNTSGFTTFLDDQVWFLPKTALYAGTGFGFNFAFNLTVGGTHVDTVQPVSVAFSTDLPRTQFAVNSFNINFGGFQCRTGCNGLAVWSFSNVLQNAGSPGMAISASVVSTPSNYSLPPAASQPGGRNTIDTGDTRISGATQYKAGSIYATLNTNNGGGGSAILAYQIHAYLNDNGDGHCTGAFLNACPTLAGAGVDNEFSYDIGGGTALNAFFGTIQPDAERNLTMVFSFSGDNFFPSVAYTSNRATQAPGHWHDTGVFLCNGQAFYNQQRWGDYTGIHIETSSPGRMWFSGMFSQSNGNWGTCIGRNGYVSANQP